MAPWVRDEFSYTSPGVGTATTKQNRAGWTVGAGLEYGLSPNWSIAAQYNYVDLGDKTYPLGDPDAVDVKTHLVRVGVNYRFATGKAPAPVVTKY